MRYYNLWQDDKNNSSLDYRERVKCVFPVDVKSVFLHGKLYEEVYVEQPLGFQKINKEMLYKMKMDLCSSLMNTLFLSSIKKKEEVLWS